ncbi:hypothetical protein [Streptomyces albireticuli]|uniref:hypothetical protein n=1 Tax=Streptomyces albireticuli TaxID=1940 RepID=UPI0036CE2322
MPTGIQPCTGLRRLPIAVAGLSAASLLFGAGAAYTAATKAVGRAASSAVVTMDQYEFINTGLGPEALAELEHAMATSAQDGLEGASLIAAAVIAAAAWDVRGTVGGIPTSVLADVAGGTFSGKGAYATNAIINSLRGEIDDQAWKALPTSVKDKAASLVAAFVIKYIRLETRPAGGHPQS